ncbi:MAG: urate hydroxylase PuuD [Acidobacteria bacterium]|nr:urate hydroxylase PuuD [Acidobacteriota bacterium]
MTWPSDWQTNVTFLLRWGHLLAGITWIGMLYFFNLVNVNFMKELDAATKGKVVPNLMPKALWWFRWGAFWTVLTGLLYYMLILHTEANVGRTLGVVLIGWIVAWLIEAALLRMSVAGGPLKDGRVLGSSWAPRATSRSSRGSAGGRKKLSAISRQPEVTETGGFGRPFRFPPKVEKLRTDD